MTGWILFFIVGALVCIASAIGIVELRWDKAGMKLSRWLRTLSDRLDGMIGVKTPEQKNFDRETTPAPNPSSPVSASRTARIDHKGSEAGWYKVLAAENLLTCIEAEEVIKKIGVASRLSTQIFQRDLLPALRSYAEFVQLMPASEAHHHANPGGLLAHALETVLHAVTFRTGYLLPRGAGAETIAAERDYWTYAVILGALLHDVGKPVADLQISMRRGKTAEPLMWSPLAGSLNSCGATEYFVGFKKKAERDYASHSRFGHVLLQQLVPDETLALMSRAPTVLHELGRYLSGESTDGALSEIIKKADQESTRRNLTSGSRARFETAKSVPLIEKLMGAIKAMLAQGGYLPLNRDGSAGWVYDNSIWFVAKRLADSVREFIIQHSHADDDGIPGETKNDRLFDAWQEYGYIIANPVTNQAVWRVVVKATTKTGEMAYQHELSVLRFPLSKVWSDPSEFPEAMLGKIEVITPEPKAIPGVSLEQATPQKEQANESQNEFAIEASADLMMDRQIKSDSQAREVQVDDTAEIATTKRIPAPKFASGTSESKLKKLNAESDNLLDDVDSAKSEANQIRRDRLSQQAKNRHGSKKIDGSDSSAKSSSFLEGGGASSDPKKISGQAHESRTAEAVPLPRQEIPTMGAAKSKEPTELAIRFMKWVQAGLSEGVIKHNEAGAPVHFVEYGMALVSPLIFKLFSSAAATGDASGSGATEEEFALQTQRELIRAQWHAPAPGGKNVWTLYVMKKGGHSASKLSAVILKDPKIWVVPVPPPNPYISATEPPSNQADS